jgi:hypothetical protein
MDGLVTNSSLIAGVGGGGGGPGAIVLTGIAGAFSMATGEYISVTSQNELTGRPGYGAPARGDRDRPGAETVPGGRADEGDRVGVGHVPPGHPRVAGDDGQHVPVGGDSELDVGGSPGRETAAAGR